MVDGITVPFTVRPFRPGVFWFVGGFVLFLWKEVRLSFANFLDFSSFTVGFCPVVGPFHFYSSPPSDEGLRCRKVSPYFPCTGGISCVPSSGKKFRRLLKLDELSARFPP